MTLGWVTLGWVTPGWVTLGWVTLGWVREAGIYLILHGRIDRKERRGKKSEYKPEFWESFCQMRVVANPVRV